MMERPITECPERLDSRRTSDSDGGDQLLWRRAAAYTVFYGLNLQVSYLVSEPEIAVRGSAVEASTASRASNQSRPRGLVRHDRGPGFKIVGWIAADPIAAFKTWQDYTVYLQIWAGLGLP